MTDSRPPFAEFDLVWLRKASAELVSDLTVENMWEYARDVQVEGAEIAGATYAVELALSKALIAVSGWFALALHANDNALRLYPADWLQPEPRGNPDAILSCVLCQLANYGYAVVNLVEKGIDTPARALLRATADLSYLLAVVASDREAFQAYTLPGSESPKEQWYKLFSNRKTAARFRKIDAERGLPPEWTEWMRGFREENNEFFSEAIHHSATSVLVGAMPTIPGTENVSFGLLGGPNGASRPTLGHLATTMNYGLSMFEASTKHLKLPAQFSKPEFWKSGLELLERIQPVFVRWLRSRQSANNGVQATRETHAPDA